MTQEEADTMEMRHNLTGKPKVGWVVVERHGDGYCRVSHKRDLAKYAYIALESLLAPVGKLNNNILNRAIELRRELSSGRSKVIELKIV